MEKRKKENIIEQMDEQFFNSVKKMLPQMIDIMNKDLDEDLPQERQKAVIEAKKLAFETYITIRNKILEIQEEQTNESFKMLTATKKQFSADDFV